MTVDFLIVDELNEEGVEESVEWGFRALAENENW